MSAMRDRKLAGMMGFKVNDLEIVKITFADPYWRAKLMDWATEQEWWIYFVQNSFNAWLKIKYDGGNKEVEADFYTYLWRNLPSLLVEYHGEEEHA